MYSIIDKIPLVLLGIIMSAGNSSPVVPVASLLISVSISAAS